MITRCDGIGLTHRTTVALACGRCGDAPTLSGWARQGHAAADERCAPSHQQCRRCAQGLAVGYHVRDWHSRDAGSLMRIVAAPQGPPLRSAQSLCSLVAGLQAAA